MLQIWLLRLQQKIPAIFYRQWRQKLYVRPSKLVPCNKYETNPQLNYIIISYRWVLDVTTVHDDTYAIIMEAVRDSNWYFSYYWYTENFDTKKMMLNMNADPTKLPSSWKFDWKLPYSQIYSSSCIFLQ